MKRMGIWLLLVLLSVSLCGCLLDPAENLYAIPKQSEDFYNLQSAIEAAMPVGAVYSPPTAGENQQAVQLSDLDGDGADEAIVYLKTTAQSSLSVCVFDQVEGSFQLVGRAEGAGAAFDHVLYVDIDDEPGREIVIGRQISSQVPQVLTVYSLQEDGTLLELLSANYTEFITTDLNNDGLPGLFVLHADVDAQNGIAAYYHWVDGHLMREREVQMSTAVTAVKRIITGQMAEGVPAVFVASEYGEGSIITDIFGFRKGAFTNLTRADDSFTGVETVREYYVYCADIDNDGLIELPQLQPMQVLEEDESSYNQSLICWYNLLLNGTVKEKAITWHNYPGGWYLEIPASWEHHLALSRTKVLSNANAYSFTWVDGSRSSHLFTIVAIGGEGAEQTAQANGFEIIAQKGETIYAALLGEAATSRGIDYERLREMFHFIRVDWNTGETG